MATLSPPTDTKAGILNRLIRPNEPLSPSAARAILQIDFAAADQARMQDLANKARAGALTADEQAAINCYEIAGHIIDLLHSRARRTLKQHTAGK